jgi:RNA polymerase sigma-70 factor, ECF subfamily
VNPLRLGAVYQVCAMRRMDEAAGHYTELLVTAGRDDAADDRDFERLVRDTSELAVRVAYSVLRQREDAEEVAQEAFARAYPRFGSLRDPEHFRAWIVRVTWRAAVDRWRSDRRRQAREEAVATGSVAASVEQMAVEGQRAARLWDAIERLPEKLRLVIVLGALQGHDVHQVARLLNIPEGTVKSRLFLARKELAQRLTCLANDSGQR